jgi:type IV pilus assembly protein PilW
MRLSATQRFQQGLSIVELMVAVVIGLIGMVIIFQVFEVSEGIKRTTTSGGDAQQNGAIALYVMEKDLRSGGMGFNDTPYAGCNVVGNDTARSPANFPVTAGTMPLVPVRIVPGASATDPDQISVFYGSQTRVASAVVLSANQAAGVPTDPLHVVSRYGFRQGDLLVLLEPGVVKDCAIMEVTELPTVPATAKDQIEHGTSPYTMSWSGTTKTPRFNPHGTIVYGGAGTSNATRVFNLGNLYDSAATPVYNTYSIAGNNLQYTSAFSLAPTLANAVADNIVHMRAQYGVDDGVNNGTVTFSSTFTAGDGIIDQFISTTPNWQRVIAIRIAVVARSQLAEKPTTGAICDATTAFPTWSGGTFDVSATVTAPDDWKCYRYRVFETTVPLRNWIWKAS